MPENLALSTAPLPSKARVLIASLIDFAVDLVVPTAIYLLLAPTRLSAVVRLTIGGFFIGAKACSGRISGDGESGGRAPSSRAFLVAALIALASTAVTVATIRAGGSDKLAIGLGSAVLVVVQAIRLAGARRRLDSFALLVALEMAATIVLTQVSSDPRFVLIRPSFYTAIAGAYVLSTVWTARPFMMQASKPMAAGGNPVRAEAFERAGRESPRFRRMEQAMTLGLAIVLMGESVLRAVTVLSRPASDVLATSLWSHVPAIGLFVVYFAVARFVFVPRASREVDAFMSAVTVTAAVNEQRLEV